MALTLTKSKLLLVEGNDEVNFFEGLISNTGLSDIDIFDMGGKDFLRNRERVETLLRKAPGHDLVTSVGITRDADTDPNAAFQQIQNLLQSLSLPTPDNPLESVGNSPRVTVMILPGDGRAGMLEDLCLESVAESPTIACIEDYFDCLERAPELTHATYVAKSRMRAYLSRLELLEAEAYESFQEHLQTSVFTMPHNQIPEKVHAFLATMPKPDLRLGQACKAGYFPLEHEAFDGIRQFLNLL